MGSFFFFPSIEFPRNYSFLGNRNNNFSDEIRDRVRTLRKIFLDDPTIFLSNFYRELFSEYIFFQTVYPDFINYLVVTRYTCFKGIRNISFHLLRRANIISWKFQEGDRDFSYLYFPEADLGFGRSYASRALSFFLVGLMHFLLGSIHFPNDFSNVKLSSKISRIQRPVSRRYGNIYCRTLLNLFTQRKRDKKIYHRNYKIRILRKV